MTYAALYGAPYVVLGCVTCAERWDFRPSHWGSLSCQSGSIASGGTHAHCTCDACF